ncbi:MAG: hypothetical protein U0M88_00365 [Faecalicoccus sp.]|uniref:hypothetical protein n=1 Tax=Faecalicoccus sp. TaxID=1971758 RepID=UPI002F92D9DB
MDSGVLSVVVTLVLIGFGIYELYNGIKQLVIHHKNKQEYMENHAKKYEFFEEYKLWFAIYVLVAVASFATACYQMFAKNDGMYAIGFWVLCACCISFALDCLVKRRAWFYEDGFFYEKKYYRYRSVINVSKTNKLRPGFNVSFSKDPSMIVTRKMALKIKEKMQEAKENKKKRK